MRTDNKKQKVKNIKQNKILQPLCVCVWIMRTDKGCPDRTLKAAKQDSEILQEEDLDEDLDCGDEDDDTDFQDDNGDNEDSYATAADGEDRDEVDDDEEDVDAVNVTMLMWLWMVGWYATNHMSIQPHGWYATSEGE